MALGNKPCDHRSGQQGHRGYRFEIASGAAAHVAIAILYEKYGDKIGRTAIVCRKQWPDLVQSSALKGIQSYRVECLKLTSAT